MGRCGGRGWRSPVLCQRAHQIEAAALAALSVDVHTVAQIAGRRHAGGQGVPRRKIRERVGFGQLSRIGHPEVSGSGIHKARFDLVDGVVGQQLLGAAGRVGRLAAALIADAQGMTGWPIPEHIADNLQIVVGERRRRHVQTSGRDDRPVHRQVLPLALHPSRIDNQVVVDENVAVWNFCFVADCHRPPATGSVVGRAAGRIAVARTAAVHDLQQMTAGAHSIKRIVGVQHCVAAVDTQPGPCGVVDQIVDRTHGVGFIVQPGGDHVLKASALAGRKPTCAAIENLVSFHRDISRSTLDIHAPVLGIVDTVVAQRGVLHGDKIYRIFVAAVNVTLFDRDMLGLIDLDRLVRLTVASVHLDVVDPQMAAQFAMKDIPVIFDHQIDQVQMLRVVQIDRPLDPCAAWAVDRPKDDRRARRPMSIFPVAWNGAFRVFSCHKQDRIPRGQRDARRNPPPRFGEGVQRLAAAGSICAVAAVDRIHPEFDRVACTGRDTAVGIPGCTSLCTRPPFYGSSRILYGCQHNHDPQNDQATASHILFSQ